MRVLELWRYPVKSVGGERLEDSDVLSTGLDGDRRWGIVDLKTGRVLTARREPRLLFAEARLVAPEEVAIRLPGGSETVDSGVLSEWLGRPVSLERAGKSGGLYENPRDYENEADWVSWRGPGEAWHDMKRARISLVSTGSLGAWDVRRFRPNVVLDGEGEDELVGSGVRIGTVVLNVTKQIDRCVIVTRAQPGVETNLEILRKINKERDSFLAIGALVESTGRIAVGDELVVLSSGMTGERGGASSTAASRPGPESK